MGYAWSPVVLGSWHTFGKYLLFFSCPVVSDSSQPHGLQRISLPIPHRLLKFAQVHVHCIGDAIQPSHPHPLSSPSPLALNPSQHQGLFKWVNSFTWGGQSIGVLGSASVLSISTQDWSPLGWTGWISLQSKGLSRVFSNTTVQKHQFFDAQLSL